MDNSEEQIFDPDTEFTDYIEEAEKALKRLGAQIDKVIERTKIDDTFMNIQELLAIADYQVPATRFFLQRLRWEICISDSKEQYRRYKEEFRRNKAEGNTKKSFDTVKDFMNDLNKGAKEDEYKYRSVLEFLAHQPVSPHIIRAAAIGGIREIDDYLEDFGEELDEDDKLQLNVIKNRMPSFSEDE